MVVCSDPLRDDAGPLNSPNARISLLSSTFLK